MTRLTNSRIASLKPKAYRYEVWDDDGRGFGVRVGQGGTKSFVLVYHFDGAPRRLTLGAYPKTTLADARIAAGRAHKMLELGQDPGTAAVAERKAEREAETMDQLCDDYVERYAKPRKRSFDQDKRFLDREVRPRWRGKQVKELRRKDIVTLLDRIVDRGSPVTANKVLAVVRRMLNFAVERGVIELSPCFGVKAPHKETPRARALSAAEIETFWRALDASGMETNLRQILRFLLATGARRAEVGGLHKREIDTKARTWTLPAARSKNGKERIIPLSPLALAVLAEAKPYEPRNPEDDAAPAAEAAGQQDEAGWIFPSGRTGKPYQGRSIDHACHDLFMPRDRNRSRRRKVAANRKPPLLAGMPRFTPHDLRRTCATGMRELGIPLADVGLVLGHIDRSVTGRVYDQHTGLGEKRRALNLWSKRLSDIIAGKIEADNVIELARA